MNCSNQSPENDKKGVCRSAYRKRYYAENRKRILARQKQWRTENPVAVKVRNRRWYEKKTSNDSPAAVKTTGNG